MNKGWVSIHRKLLDNCLWLQGTPTQKLLIVTLILLANNQDREWIFKGERIMVKRGQLITSLNKLQEVMGKGITIRQIRTAIDNLKKFGFLTNQESSTGRLIEVVNYSKYQDNNKGNDKHDGKQESKESQRRVKQGSSNNKDYKENNVINYKGARYRISERKEVKSKNGRSKNFTERDYEDKEIQGRIRGFYEE